MSTTCDSFRRPRMRRWAAPAVVALIGTAVPVVSSEMPVTAAGPVTFTVLHTNDFHGNLEPSGSNPGAARVAATVNTVRAGVGEENVLLFDAGDMMQGSLLSNLQQGAPVIADYRTLGYDAATFGNHEFDWGQTVLGNRVAQAEAPATATETPMQMVAANITVKSGDTCTWDPFNPSVAPYEVFTVGAAPDTVRVGVIGVGSVETPFITVAAATAGLCFRDPFETISHYYAELDAASDVIIVLSHNGYVDGGYGYGFTVYGDQTLASKLNSAGTPVNMIIGGHSHTNLSAATMVGSTTVVQAYYAGRVVGRADVTYDPATGASGIAWTRLGVATTDPQDPTVHALVTSYASDPAYQALINTPVGYSQVDLLRNYNGDNMMGDFVDDAIYGALNEDANPANDVDMFFNNPGGIRTDWCDKEDPANPGTFIWSSAAADCAAEGVWSHDPMLLTYGQMFSILPFGNATAVGTMTGAQIYDLLDQSATLFKGALQPSGIRYSFFRYSDTLPGPQPWAWGAFGIEVFDRATNSWEPLDAARTYQVGTNEFLAPAGQDGFTPFKYMTGMTYWGDMLDAVNAYVSAHYTADDPYRGPDGDGTLDGRIGRTGTDTYVPGAPGQVVPLTVLHHNDSHGRLLKAGTTPGYSQLVTLINQERAHNTGRTLLVSSGDNIQGDSTMYYFKSAGLGYTSDGTPLSSDMSINPLIKAFNAVGYDAWTLGNHEFNFGNEVFATLSQADFPVLQANVADTGAYGLSAVPVEPHTTQSVGPEGIDVAILGIGNHRVPSYELPSNIEGLTFTDPIQTGNDLAPTLQAANDVVIALTHIGFTENPASVEVDANVDTTFAAQVTGVDAVIGGHSHTRPDTGFGAYKYLPAFVAGPDGQPVLVTQAYRYNTFLGEVVLGLLPDGSGGYEVVSTAGRTVPVTSSTPEDPTIVGLVQPYQAMISSYNNTVIGSTTAPIDTLQAFTHETNGANLQADASVWKLESEGVAVDVHLSGAMTNSRIAAAATSAAPYELKVSDMFTSMPYENSLVVMEMNGPQLKQVLERAYRNYFYYRYVPGYGGYSYYTTCMLDTDAGNQIVYRDENPALPDGDNVAGLLIGGVPVDFADASTYYRVSSVNYLAAGACNFSDGGASLWPLDQIVADTQYYVRDAVIEYVEAQTSPISPAIEGRLVFTPPPAPTVATPAVTPEPSIIGRLVTVSATFTDPGVIHGPVSCTVDFGDGASAVAGTISGNSCTATHRYWWYGTHTVTVDVADAVGTVGSASVTHAVVFDYSGPYPPLWETDNVAKAGSTIPVKFSLGWFFGFGIFASGSPNVTPCSGGSPVSASGRVRYEWWSGTYVFLWNTSRSWKGTCRAFTFTLVDGTTHRIEVRFT
jgi:2',3'-cyclic-nucleotide 2'-phosphodiesterase / 3'-nucleotidase / 5'-nucleotidase